MTEQQDLPATEMIYYTYDGNFQLECAAKVLSCQFIDNNNSEKEEDKKEEDGEDAASKAVHLCLDKTVLHAQGGGQPTDLGNISSSDHNDGTKIEITKVVVDRSTGVATHTGTVSSSVGNLRPGDTVHVSVNKENREILSECHTAGHVVDSGE